MNLIVLPSRLATLPASVARGLRGMFNLNDGKWGRSDDKPGSGSESGAPPAPDAAPTASPTPAPSAPPASTPPAEPSNVRPIGSGGGGSKGPNQGPPDLDELWRDFNKKLNGLFGNKRPPGNKQQPDWNRHNNQGGSGGGNNGGFQPDMKSAGIGAGLIAAIAVIIWLGTGFFIVQEGQQAVITRFGKLDSKVEAGFNWRWPYPIERHETVALTQLRSVEIGRGGASQATGLKESSMLTQDENIVDIRFTIQYRLKSASDYLFENRSPDDAVTKAAESAIREVVGRGTMDGVLNKDRESIQRDVMKSVQAQLDRYKTGILIQNVNIQNVQPPEAVQAAFDDALKAGQDRDRLKNEGQAYANDVIPRAKGTAARLKEEADGYKANVVARAEGDAQRFKSVLTEYQKAPQVTRDRMYLDAMQQIYSGVTKVMVDSSKGNNLLYLPLDRIMQQSASAGADTITIPAGSAQAAPNTVAPNASIDARSRDAARSRERDVR
ncbi:MAG: FtsH protease activity modulator HflK [Burkholderiaceae bacterium]